MEVNSTFKYVFQNNPIGVIKPAQFGTPRLVDYYSENYGIIKRGQKILYFNEPTRNEYPLDLNILYEKYRARKSYMYREYTNISLKYAMSSEADVNDADRTMVYTRKGALTHLMQSIYMPFKNGKADHLCIRVSRYDGNIYMVHEETDDSEFKKPPSQTHHNRLDKVLFKESPNETSQTTEPCDENIRLVAVHRSTLGKYDIVYSGEVQGIIADEKFTDFDDIEALNDCRFVLAKQMWNKFKYDDKKRLNYWLQAYLANVQDIYFAYKEGSGIVREPIEHKSVSDLPKNSSWNPKTCFAFLQYFLEGIEKIMSNVNCLNTVYVFQLNSNDMKISHTIYKGKNDKTFISKEYMDFIKN